MGPRFIAIPRKPRIGNFPESQRFLPAIFYSTRYAFRHALQVAPEVPPGSARSLWVALIVEPAGAAQRRDRSNKGGSAAGVERSIGSVRLAWLLFPEPSPLGKQSVQRHVPDNASIDERIEIERGP